MHYHGPHNCAAHAKARHSISPTQFRLGMKQTMDAKQTGQCSPGRAGHLIEQQAQGALGVPAPLAQAVSPLPGKQGHRLGGRRSTHPCQCPDSQRFACHTLCCRASLYKCLRSLDASIHPMPVSCGDDRFTSHTGCETANVALADAVGKPLAGVTCAWGPMQQQSPAPHTTPCQALALKWRHLQTSAR